MSGRFSIPRPTAALLCLAAAGLLAAPETIKPGEVWPDDRGQHIQAHGGGIIKLRDTYYWFGENRTPGLDPNRRYVACCSSKDLAHWTFRNQVMEQTDPGDLGPRFVLERPNAMTCRFCSSLKTLLTRTEDTVLTSWSMSQITLSTGRF